jgi:fructoselysine-6-P-deglycase FrlB-like protein
MTTGDPFAGADANPIERYIREIPAVVARTVAGAREQLASWAPVANDSLVLVGSGTSFNALVATAASFTADGRHLAVLTPGAMMRREELRSTRPLVLGLSQSGASATTVAALRHASDLDLPTIAVTMDAQSAIVRHAHRTMLLPVGAEPVGPKTKGYAASLAALFALAEWLAGRTAGDIDPAELASVLAAARDAVPLLASELDDVDVIVIAGEDRHLGTAMEASLKIAEMSGVPAAAFVLEEMLHGRLHGLTVRSLGILIAADAEQREASLRAATVMAQHGVRILILNLTNVPTDHDWRFAVNWPMPPFDAIAAILPFQLLAACLSLRRGRAPHQMRFPDLASRLGIRLVAPS